jgi:hypothetical protein
MNKWIALCFSVTASMLLTEIGSAQQPSVPKPLLVVEGTETLFQTQGGPNLTDTFALFVMPAGDVVESDQPPPSVSILRGPATTPLFNQLRQSLEASQPGIQRGCRGSALLIADCLSFDWQITWFGNHGRRNRFRVASDDQSLPECTEKVSALVGEIAHFRFAFLRLRSTQLLFGGY